MTISQELRAARAQAIAEAMGCDDDEATRQALAILGLPNNPKNREGVTAAQD